MSLRSGVIFLFVSLGRLISNTYKGVIVGLSEGFVYSKDNITLRSSSDVSGTKVGSSLLTRKASILLRRLKEILLIKILENSREILNFR